MNICIFSTTYFPKAGGAERFIHGLAYNLINLGNTVYVLVPYDEKLDLQRLVGYKILRLRFIGLVRNFPILYEFILFLNLLFYFLKYRFNVVQAVLLYPAGYVASLTTKFFRIPSVIRPAGEDVQIYKKINYGLRLNKYVDERVRIAVKNCSNVIAISPSIKKDLLDVKCSEEKIVPISNGIDVERFEKEPSHNIKKDLEIRDSELLAISVGRNHIKKDYKTLISAISLCKTNVKLVIVGGNEEGLKEFIPKNKEDRYILLGQVPKDFSVQSSNFKFPPDIVVDYLKTSNVYVSTSLIEGSPNVIIEAMAAGLPIIAVDAPGTRDYVANGVNGFLVSPKNPKELAKTIDKLFSNKSLLKTFSAESKRISKGFSWRAVVEEYLKVYNRLVES